MKLLMDLMSDKWEDFPGALVNIVFRNASNLSLRHPGMLPPCKVEIQRVVFVTFNVAILCE